MPSALELARTAYRGISIYAPDRAPCAIDLSDNTSVFGVPPSALKELRTTTETTVLRYPALYAGELKAALARYVGVSPSEIVTGCGSDDVLDSAIRAFAEPGDVVATPDPSFVMIPILARMNGLTPVGVPLRADYDIDVDALLATRARIIYICSPNNPTGTLATRASIRRVLEEAPGLVILDEAYAEFSGISCITEAPRWGRLLVVRTLSKAFGLAGLRVGYAAGATALVAEVEKARGPYKVSSLAERAALSALTHDMEWVRSRIDDVVGLRVRFRAELVANGFAPLASHANFLLIPVARAEDVAAAMRRRGVAVRPMADLPGIGDAVRIGIGPWPMLQSTLDALYASVT
jgi:histidinol-phosphate aminotransferase